jgi:hypothetical protein
MEYTQYEVEPELDLLLDHDIETWVMEKDGTLRHFPIPAQPAEPEDSTEYDEF